MNYDVFNVGESEFVYGWQYIQTRAQENPIFISANLVDSKTQKPIFPPYKIKSFTYSYETVDSKNRIQSTKVKTNIAILGVLSQSQIPQIQAYLQADSTLCTIANPVEISNKLIPTLRKNSDIVIVLAHLPQSEAENFAKQVPGIDILITGHDSIQLVNPPLLVGTDTTVKRAIMVTNGDRGRMGGSLELRFNQAKRIINFRGKEIPLSSEFADDSTVATLVAEYKKAVAALAPVPDRR